MSNATAKAVMRMAILQNGYTESPAGSNRTKFGAAFGMNGVAWCMEYEWWCGEIASGSNPFPRNANAAYGQDDIVAKKGGSWVMKKTASRETKKAGLGKARFGDCVDFDFGKNNMYRYHTALVIGTAGNDYITIEGNTSPEGKSGSQSNGGMVAIRRRHYSLVCSNARPAYGTLRRYTPDGPFRSTVPELKKGAITIGSKGADVKRLQRAVNWAADAKVEVDGVFGNETLFGVIWFQHSTGLVPDGEFGPRSLAKLNEIVARYAVKPRTTKAEKIIEKAVDYAYPKGTAKATYAYKGGRPKPEYAKALDKIFPRHDSWADKVTRTGASCSVFVATSVRSSGVDKTFLCDNPPKIIDYMRKSTKWVKKNTGKKPLPLSQLQPGDIIAYEKAGAAGDGHILLYKGGGYCVEANHGRYYPHTLQIPKAYLNETYINNTYKRFVIYRAKE